MIYMIDTALPSFLEVLVIMSKGLWGRAQRQLLS